MSEQPDLFTSAEPAPAAAEDRMQVDARSLRNYLGCYKEFRTRDQICSQLAWTERHLRQVAELLGAEIVRCQAGFKLTKDITRDDLPLALQAADAFKAQGKRMLVYSFHLRKRLHSLVG